MFNLLESKLTGLCLVLSLIGCSRPESMQSAQTQPSPSPPTLSPTRAPLHDSPQNNSKAAQMGGMGDKADPIFELCIARYIKKGISRVHARNFCGGQVGELFGYGELDEIRRAQKAVKKAEETERRLRKEECMDAPKRP